MKNEMLNDIVLKLEEKIINTRRHLHKNPELSSEEYNTMAFICNYLDEIGVSYTSKMAGTGVVAIIKGEGNGYNNKTLLFRADIDALPITEKSDKDYISTKNGVMHACGHDGHTAMMLGVCETLNELKADFSGTVKVIFQPAEEGDGGALPMINEGVLENPSVDSCLALHLEPGLECGKIRITPGPLYASPDTFKIVVKGKGGHGAQPHLCVDPINISAQIITYLNTIISREINPLDNVLISVTTINSGTAPNVIPSEATITGTARSYSDTIRQFLKKRIGEVAQELCKSRGASCEYEFFESFPPLINDKNLSENLYQIAKKYFDEYDCILGGAPTMMGEDFAYFTQRVPSVLFMLGCRNEAKGISNPLHHESFDIDEDCFKNGVILFSAFALEFLS